MKKEFYLKLAKRNSLSILVLNFCLISFLSFSGCSDKKGYDDKTLAKIYVENLIAQEKYEEDKDSLMIARNKIFTESGITKDEFENAMKSFGNDRERWAAFFKEANSYLHERQKTKAF